MTHQIPPQQQQRTNSGDTFQSTVTSVVGNVMMQNMMGNNNNNDGSNLNFGNIANSNNNTSGNNPNSNMVMDLGLKFGQSIVDDTRGRLNSIETSELRKRFTVTHEYVLTKLRLIAFPFRHKFQKMEFGLDLDDGNNNNNNNLAQQQQNSSSSAGNDIESPDLYLPLMGLITYVVMCAFGRGFSASSLDPTEIATTVSASAVLLVLEALAVKLWRMVTSLPPPVFLDSIALFGYFFVSVCYAVMARAFFDLWFPLLSWILTLYNLGAFCFFMYKSLGETFMKDGIIPKRAMPILYAATLLQAPLFLWFVRRAY